MLLAARRPTIEVGRRPDAECCCALVGLRGRLVDATVVVDNVGTALELLDVRCPGRRAGRVLEDSLGRPLKERPLAGSSLTSVVIATGPGCGQLHMKKRQPGVIRWFAVAPLKLCFAVNRNDARSSNFDAC